MKKYTRLLTIAGSDSGGGAGIQADLKTFSACGCYGMSAVTALTAQNTQGVRAIHPVPVAFLEAQIRAVLEDIGVDAIKIGMLHSSEVIETVARLLKDFRCERVVLDPVMVATSGDKLIEDGAIESMKSQLFPVVTMITPNIPEAQLLLGQEISGEKDLPAAARKLSDEHNLSILLKAGHLSGDRLQDVLITVHNGEQYLYTNRRVTTRNTHGTGCTLSSAVASFLGRGLDLPEAVKEAEKYLHQAITTGSEYTLGQGYGPVHHFAPYWE